MSDENTAIVPAEIRESKTFENDFDVSGMLTTVGKLEASKAQSDILFAPIDPDDILIRPDGLVYLDWQWYAGRLIQTFPLRWALIPQGMPKINGNLVVWGFWLLIDGHLMGFAIGEQSRANPNMSYAECCEGAKSNALMRLCKGLGMARNLWHRPFIDEWKDKYAEQYVDDKGRKLQRRKTLPKSGNDSAPVSGDDSAASESGISGQPAAPIPETAPRMITNWAGKEVPAEEPIGTKVAAMAKFQTLFVDKFNHAEHFRNHIKKHFGAEKASELTWEQAVALHDHLYDAKDDPRFYVKETIVSGWDAEPVAKELYVAKGLQALYNTVHEHMGLRLGSIDGQKYLRVMTEVASAVGTALSRPPTDEDIKEIKDILDKEFPKNA